MYVRQLEVNKCDAYVKCMRAAVDAHTPIKNANKCLLTSQVERIVVPTRSDDSIGMQLEIICSNSICNVEMVTFLVDLLTELSSKVLLTKA
jgi:hypothetical protein